MGRVIPKISNGAELGIGAALVVAIILIIIMSKKNGESYPRRRKKARRKKRRRRKGRADVISKSETFIRKEDDLGRARQWQQKYKF